jgi:hypothetical protein
MRPEVHLNVRNYELSTKVSEGWFICRVTRAGSTTTRTEPRVDWNSALYKNYHSVCKPFRSTVSGLKVNSVHHKIRSWINIHMRGYRGWQDLSTQVRAAQKSPFRCWRTKFIIHVGSRGMWGDTQVERLVKSRTAIFLSHSQWRR